MHAIRADNLTKIYKRKTLTKVHETVGVKDMSFEINQGEIFGLLGLNGSGKTTTIKLILGLLYPTAGSIAIFGKNTPDQDVLKDIGYMPEVPYFYKYLTAAEILRFYGNLSGIADIEMKVKEMLEVVGLKEWQDRRLSEFSKGMVQRIGIAQSLLHDPKILIYDEPVSGLDPLAVAEMRSLIIKLKSKGKTIFLSSHLISEVEKVCDRVGILVKGNLVRIVNQDEWSGKEGELEKIFVSCVSGSSEVGRINF
ncbi:MAG: ABC transporter ATP-binding protein [Elusimicrobia bacterium]|nr:ABC transporter ATP-binding protein [Candidatus Liberimonas magnetica]